ncbi:hypothetical protein B9C57_02485 [Tenacibaculum maritimum]|nr:hypothetical protein B9C57_02485 [Tenacibaculum maritimum]
MNRVWKFFQYGYLIIAIICLVEGLLKLNSDRPTAYILLAFAIFITLIFFFKRKFRKKVVQRNSSKN